MSQAWGMRSRMQPLWEHTQKTVRARGLALVSIQSAAVRKQTHSTCRLTMRVDPSQAEASVGSPIKAVSCCSPDVTATSLGPHALEGADPAAVYEGVRARVAALGAEVAEAVEAAEMLRAQLAAAVARHGAGMADAERMRQVRSPTGPNTAHSPSCFYSFSREGSEAIMTSSA